jgi:YD repeat-containing protein
MLPRLNQYDNANRLLQLRQGASTVSFAYDSGGRRTSITLANGVTMSYSYDADSEPLSVSYQLSEKKVSGTFSLTW